MAQLLDTGNNSYAKNLLGGLSVITEITGETRATSQITRIAYSRPGILSPPKLLPYYS